MSIYTWDYLAAEGFSVKQAALHMDCTPRTADRELHAARLRSLGPHGVDQDTISAEVRNDVYQAFIDWATDGGMNRPVPETDLSRTFAL